MVNKPAIAVPVLKGKPNVLVKVISKKLKNFIVQGNSILKITIKMPKTAILAIINDFSVIFSVVLK